MEILYLLIPVALILFGVILWAFSWSVKNDQFEDLDRHGYDLLFDDDLLDSDKKGIDTLKPETKKATDDC